MCMDLKSLILCLPGHIQVKEKLSAQQDLNRKLTAELEEASNRSIVMEVMATKALDQSKQYEEQRPHIFTLERDLADAYVLIQTLCTSIDGDQFSALGEGALLDAIGDKKVSATTCTMISSMACERVKSLHDQLSQIKENHQQLEIQFKKQTSLLWKQRIRLGRALEGMDTVGGQIERELAKLKSEKTMILKKAHGTKLSLEVQLSLQSAKCTRLQTMLDEITYSQDFSQESFLREGSLLGHQLERITFDFGSVVQDLREGFDAALRREAELNVQLDNYKSHQKILAVMMERIWLAIAVHAEGKQAWRYLETAMATNPVTQVSKGLPERADEICRIIVQLRDRLVACESEEQARSDLAASQEHEVSAIVGEVMR